MAIIDCFLATQDLKARHNQALHLPLDNAYPLPASVRPAIQKSTCTGGGAALQSDVGRAASDDLLGYSAYRKKRFCLQF
jgi:hypothetical protein